MVGREVRKIIIEGLHLLNECYSSNGLLSQMPDDSFFQLITAITDTMVPMSYIEPGREAGQKSVPLLIDDNPLGEVTILKEQDIVDEGVLFEEVDNQEEEALETNLENEDEVFLSMVPVIDPYPQVYYGLFVKPAHLNTINDSFFSNAGEQIMVEESKKCEVVLEEEYKGLQISDNGEEGVVKSLKIDIKEEAVDFKIGLRSSDIDSHIKNDLPIKKNHEYKDENWTDLLRGTMEYAKSESKVIVHIDKKPLEEGYKEIEKIIHHNHETADKIINHHNRRDIEYSLTHNNVQASKHNIRRITDSIIKLVETKAEGNTSAVRVKLHPEELGSVDVMLKMEKGEVVARIVVDNDYTKQLFTNKISEINENLIRQNINLGRLDISLGSDSKGSTGGNNEGFQKRHRFNNYEKNSLNSIILEENTMVRGAISILA